MFIILFIYWYSFVMLLYINLNKECCFMGFIIMFDRFLILFFICFSFNKYLLLNIVIVFWIILLFLIILFILFLYLFRICWVKVFFCSWYKLFDVILFVSFIFGFFLSFRRMSSRINSFWFLFGWKMMIFFLEI